MGRGAWVARRSRGWGAGKGQRPSGGGVGFGLCFQLVGDGLVAVAEMGEVVAVREGLADAFFDAADVVLELGEFELGFDAADGSFKAFDEIGGEGFGVLGGDADLLLGSVAEADG